MFDFASLQSKATSSVIGSTNVCVFFVSLRSVFDLIFDVFVQHTNIIYNGINELFFLT